MQMKYRCEDVLGLAVLLFLFPCRHVTRSSKCADAPLGYRQHKTKEYEENILLKVVEK